MDHPSKRFVFLEDTPASEDLLGRRPFAKLIANRILSFHPEESFTFGIYGPWGIGKTTLLNFVRSELRKTLKENRARKARQPPSFVRHDPKEPIIFEFKPWLFSDRRDLVVAFFETLARDLRAAEKWSRSKELSRSFEYYAQLLKPAGSVLNFGGFLKPISALFNFLRAWFGQ
jgi:predicted KAP-like P-loop ATPase